MKKLYIQPATTLQIMRSIGNICVVSVKGVLNYDGPADENDELM